MADELPCVVLEKARKQARPFVDAARAKAFAAELFGLEDLDTPEELNSYDDKNYLIKHTGGRADRYVLKIHNAADSAPETRPFLDAQNKVLAYLFSHGIVCQTCIPSVHGKEIEFVSLERPDGSTREHGIRLLHYIPGGLMAYVKQQSMGLLEDLGTYMANVDILLEGFSHPATIRSHLWDLNNLPLLKTFAALIKDESKKAIVDEIFSRFETQVAPYIPELKQIVCQSDANDHNIIVSEDGEKVAAILDFGDMVHTSRINELAITIAYALLEKEDLMGCARAIMVGYTRVLPITLREQSMLHTLVASRLCQSVVMSNYSYSQNPQNEYLLVTSRPGWQLLTALVNMSPEEVSAFNSYAHVIAE